MSARQDALASIARFAVRGSSAAMTTLERVAREERARLPLTPYGVDATTGEPPITAADRALGYARAELANERCDRALFVYDYLSPDDRAFAAANLSGVTPLHARRRATELGLLPRPTPADERRIVDRQSNQEDQ
jgi:hypothetical protein